MGTPPHIPRLLGQRSSTGMAWADRGSSRRAATDRAAVAVRGPLATALCTGSGYVRTASGMVQGSDRARRAAAVQRIEVR